MVSAAVQVGHHAIVDGQEGIEALALWLQHREDIYGPLLALADSMRSRHRTPQPAIGRQGVSGAAGDKAEGRLDALLPVRKVEIALHPSMCNTLELL